METMKPFWKLMDAIGACITIALVVVLWLRVAALERLQAEADQKIIELQIQIIGGPEARWMRRRDQEHEPSSEPLASPSPEHGSRL